VGKTARASAARAARHSDLFTMNKLRTTLMRDELIKNTSALARYRANPDQYVGEVLVSPYTGEPYRLNDVERQFILHAFKLDADGRLLYPLLVYGAIKKSRKTELAALIVITMIVLFGGKYAEAFIVANDRAQAIDRCFTACVRILEASPLLCNEVKTTKDKITSIATGSTISAVANDAAGVAGGHPCISVFDEMWCAPSGERRMFDALIPVPSRKISCRLVVSHAGFADPDHLLYQLYQRGMALPELGKDLYGGDGMLMNWSHTPQHDWQTEKWLDEMKRELPPHLFAPMIANQFVPATASYITGELFDRCCKEPGPRPSDPKLVIDVGVDASTIRDNSAVFATTTEGDGVRIVEYKIFAPTPTDPLDFENTIERTLLDLNQRYRIRRVLIDNHQMVYLAQRLSKKMKIEALVQSPGNLSMIAQNLFDLFRGERLSAFPDSKLRNIITNTIFEEKGSVLRFARHQTTKIDATVALAMACYATTQAAGEHTYRWDVYDPNFQDEDVKPQPEPEPETPFSGNPCNGDWYKWRPPPRPPPPTWPKQEPPKQQPQNEADRNLIQGYRSLDVFLKSGGRF
jgi:hypothetical protein